MTARLPDNEPARLEALRRYEVLDTPPESAFDDLTRLAAWSCRAPISLISFVDADRQWFKSRLGLEAAEVPRDVGLCAHAILQTDVFVVPDALADERFSENPLVTSPPHIRFYAGTPLLTPDGYALGTLCVLDRIPRELSADEIEALRVLARQAVAQLEFRRLLAELERTVSESRRMEGTLEATEERFQTLFEDLPMGVYRTTPDGTIVNANHALVRMLGYPSFEALSRRNLEDEGFEPSYPRHEFRERLEREGEIRGLEASWRRRDGSVIFVRENARAVRDAEGLLYYEGTVEDVTERKRVEQRKDEFVSIVSHELRTPLTSIRGSLEWITANLGEGLPPQARRLIDISKSSIDRMERLINAMLDIDKIESGRMAFDLRPVDVPSLLEQAVEANQAYGEGLGVAFVLGRVEPGLEVNADRDRLMQVLTNLLSNAAKFSPPGEAVTLSAWRRGGDVRVEVSDRGPGIPEEFRGRVFQRFAQAEGMDPRQRGGSGLGLSITRAIVEKLGGRIGFETGRDVGTTFHFDLPEWRGGPAE